MTGPPGFDVLAAGPGERDVRRAVRWLNRSGGLMPLPCEAGDLLAVRLASRVRIFWRIGVPFMAVAVAWLVWLSVLLVRGDDAGLTVAER